VTVREHISYVVRWAPVWCWFAFAFAFVSINIAVGLLR
jgi:hypothetical protein